MKVAELRQQEIERSERVVAELGELRQRTEAKIMEIEAARSAEEVGVFFMHARDFLFLPWPAPRAITCPWTLFSGGCADVKTTVGEVYPFLRACRARRQCLQGLNRGMLAMCDHIYFPTHESTKARRNGFEVWKAAVAQKQGTHRSAPHGHALDCRLSNTSIKMNPPVHLSTTPSTPRAAPVKQADKIASDRVHRVTHATLSLAERFSTSAPIKKELDNLRRLAGRDELLEAAAGSIPEEAAAKGIPTVAQLKQRYASAGVWSWVVAPKRAGGGGRQACFVCAIGSRGRRLLFLGRCLRLSSRASMSRSPSDL